MPELISYGGKGEMENCNLIQLFYLLRNVVTFLFNLCVQCSCRQAHVLFTPTEEESVLFMYEILIPAALTRLQFV